MRPLAIPISHFPSVFGLDRRLKASLRQVFHYSPCLSLAPCPSLVAKALVANIGCHCRFGHALRYFVFRRSSMAGELAISVFTASCLPFRPKFSIRFALALESRLGYPLGGRKFSNIGKDFYTDEKPSMPKKGI